MLFLPRQIPISQRTNACRTVSGSGKLSSFEPTGLAHHDYDGVSGTMLKSTINSSQN